MRITILTESEYKLKGIPIDQAEPIPVPLEWQQKTKKETKSPDKEERKEKVEATIQPVPVVQPAPATSVNPPAELSAVKPTAPSEAEAIVVKLDPIEEHKKLLAELEQLQSQNV